MSNNIEVTVEGNDITVSPTRLYLKQSSQNQEVTWTPGSGVTIQQIVFGGQSPPITPEAGQGGKWNGSFNANAALGCYKYTITLKAMQPLDPEIEYGPGGDIDDRDDKRGGYRA